MVTRLAHAGGNQRIGRLTNRFFVKSQKEWFQLVQARGGASASPFTARDCRALMREKPGCGRHVKAKTLS